MTRDDILALSDRIDRQHRRSVLATAAVPLASLVAAAAAIPQGGILPVVFAIAGGAALPLLWIRWSRTFQRIRYAGGTLNTWTSRAVVWATVVSTAGSAAIFGLVAFDQRANLILSIGAALVALWLLFMAMAQRTLGAENRTRYQIGPDGYLDSRAMRAPVTWDQVTALVPVRIRGSFGLTLRAMDDPANHRPGRKAMEARGLKGYLLNLSDTEHKAADLLLAIAENRPVLIEDLGPLLADDKDGLRPAPGMAKAGSPKGFFALATVSRLLISLLILGFTAFGLIALVLDPSRLAYLALPMAPLAIFSVLILAEAWARRPMRQKA
ncbi:MAG: hypothetical protein HY859_16310 [Caulobacterales bacterium]|nr:hypothetical protein [Caulobacterales bacterium]